ncbi:rod-binding protein [Thiomicrorhabdus aquaedulcis]|uniref:rod-binding protein n=1 Tax=Thiomicrorhabdus aquaedulcis TaxID=2211106 RepID=UPI000FDB9B9E|nr:rod-binding protein [Thiomicrorhabdus aquaedulcis]
MTTLNSSNSLTAQPHQSTGLKAHNNYTDVGALNDLKQQAREDQRAALRPVAEQFEAIFVQQILQEARKVSFDEGWLEGGQGDFYKDWSDKQLAQNLSSKGTLGFADNIVEQLAPSLPGLPSTPAESSDVTKSLKPPSTEQALLSRPLKPL